MEKEDKKEYLEVRQRYSPQEHQLLKEKAKSKGLKISSYIKSMAICSLNG